jgi:hypothetical protein
MNTGLKKSPHNPGLSFCVAQVCEMTFGTQYNGHVVLDIGGSGLVALADLDVAVARQSLDLHLHTTPGAAGASIAHKLLDARLFSRNSAQEIRGA